MIKTEYWSLHTKDVLVLLAIRDGCDYGFAVEQHIMGKYEIEVSTGLIYQRIRRLCKQGLLMEAECNANRRRGPVRKCYNLTWEGREALRRRGNSLTEITGETSDGYHTFNELYEHRYALFIALIRLLPHLSWRANNNADGSSYKGYFVTGIHLPTGDVSYHLPLKYWGELDGLDILTTNNAPKFDGHTADDVVDRLLEFKQKAYSS